MRNGRRILVLLAAIAGSSVVTGCPSPTPPTTSSASVASSAAMTAHVATTLALHTVAENRPNPGPSPAPSNHSRASCPTAGWITHGDGHRTRCPDCVPAWSEEEMPEPSVPSEEAKRRPVPATSPVIRSQPSATYRYHRKPAGQLQRFRLLPWRQ